MRRPTSRWTRTWLCSTSPWRTTRGGWFAICRRAAFQIYEDGLPQSVTLFRHEDTPVAVGLVVDNSGSMRRKLPEVVAAATAFARSSNPEDQMFVVNLQRARLAWPSSRMRRSSAIRTS